MNIGGVRFADLLPFDSIGHMFLKVRVTEGQLRFAFFDSEWLRKRISHEETDLPSQSDNGRPDESRYGRRFSIDTKTPDSVEP